MQNRINHTNDHFFSSDMGYALLCGASHGHLGYLYITDIRYLSRAAYYYFLNFKATKAGIV